MIHGSGVIGAVLYGLVILGIVLVIPRSGLSAVSGFTDAYTAVAGVLHSRALDVFFAVLVIVTLAGSGSVAGGRLPHAGHRGTGRRGPAWMGRFASFGTPIAVNLSSGVIASVMCVLVFVLSKGTLASFFAVMLAPTVSTTALSYCLSSRRWSSCAASTQAPADPTGCPEARQARGSR